MLATAPPAAATIIVVVVVVVAAAVTSVASPQLGSDYVQYFLHHLDCPRTSEC